MASAEQAKGKIEQARRNLAKKGMDFITVFGTPGGVKVLAALKEEFDPPVICRKTSNAHQVVVEAAQRDVIKYIEQMIAYRVKENEDV